MRPLTFWPVCLVVGGWLSCLVMDARASQRQSLPDPTTENDPLEQPRDGFPRRVFLELRLAETEPVRGLTFEATVKNSGTKIHLHYQTIITHSDVVKARVVESNGRYDVDITLSAESAATMASATARHAGRPVAIILDGEVVAVLTIRGPLGADVVFSGDFTREEAMRIVSGLQRW